MRLYSSRFAPSPRRVRMYAAEKGVPLEIVEIDIAAGANHAPDYLGVNPLGELPTLELDDGTRLSESLAICRWLEAENPEPALFGRTARERVRIDSAVDRLMFRLYVPLTHVFRHSHPFWATRLTQIAAWGEAQRAAVFAELDALELSLGGREFMVGTSFTMADIVAFTTIDFGKPSQVRLTDAHPNLKRWQAAIDGRPSARA